MVPWISVLLTFPVTHVFAAVDRTHGVAPELLARYKPIQSGSVQKWKCLDDSKEIPWDAVNDDYCECTDGSDEPGTGACQDTFFYCKNIGHIGAKIRSSRVRDGLCEPECCDGSDEAEGVCPNVCKEVGEAYREKMEAERKLRKTGSKIRSTYITFAQKEKTKLEDEIHKLGKEITSREKEVARLKEILDRTESLSAEALEIKKSSPLYRSLITHHDALKSLQREHKKSLEREKTLGDILDQLRHGYNPNYQDMAVLEAVRGWEEIAHLPHINDAEREEGSDEEVETPSEPEEELEEGMWSATRLEHQLDSLLNTDYTTLLIEHDRHIGASGISQSLLFDPSAYMPDAFIPSFLAFRDTFVSWLEMVGIVKHSTTGDDDAAVVKARQAYDEAERSLGNARDELKTAERSLADLFDPEGFGKDGEWKKLDGTCLSKDTGDYTYEVCLFDEARQKPNGGGSTFSLGKFNDWNTDTGVEVGSPAYYSKQTYTQGTRCWNGPSRSVSVKLSCGLENALLTIEELEKCKYQFTATSPALCLPLEQNGDGQVKDEL